MKKELLNRSGDVCEMCSNEEGLTVYEIEPKRSRGGDDCVLLCANCNSQVVGDKDIDVNHWRVLNESIWSEVEPVKVLSYRMLVRMKGEGWTDDLLDMMYLEEDTLKWAKEGIQDSSSEVKHIDSNGVQLAAGDNVVLVKDLDVKGANFAAKRGTAVRSISLVFDNADQIEGRVNGQHIVILTKFVKKS